MSKEKKYNPQENMTGLISVARRLQQGFNEEAGKKINTQRAKSSVTPLPRNTMPAQHLDITRDMDIKTLDLALYDLPQLETFQIIYRYYIDNKTPVNLTEILRHTGKPIEIISSSLALLQRTQLICNANAANSSQAYIPTDLSMRAYKPAILPLMRTFRQTLRDILPANAIATLGKATRIMAHILARGKATARNLTSGCCLSRISVDGVIEKLIKYHLVNCESGTYSDVYGLTELGKAVYLNTFAESDRKRLQELAKSLTDRQSGIMELLHDYQGTTNLTLTDIARMRSADADATQQTLDNLVALSLVHTTLGGRRYSLSVLGERVCTLVKQSQEAK